MRNTISHDSGDDGGTRFQDVEGSVTHFAEQELPYLTPSTMEPLCSIENLRAAFAKVKRNQGAPGIDDKSIQDIESRLDFYLERTRKQLLAGTYPPQPVLRRDIPKENGKTRKLGIPTVLDRMVQQACVQVLTPLLDPGFSDSSYGFRPGRSAHQAVQKASQYVQDGKVWVVDIDLEAFFDNVNHDRLMSRLASKVQDKKVLKLIRRFLKSGIMDNGIKIETVKGTPQGGPLSPLLSNVMLHDLDQELENRGHSFCRYADDCNIYVHSLPAAKRVFESTRLFIERKLKLKVNESKSACDSVHKRKFLGFTISKTGSIAPAKAAIRKAKDKIRKLTKRNQGKSLEFVISGLNSLLKGWRN
ncbi:group II intron reverse transcriptase/maturase, partial [Candidatus Bealeia paramacronuclearis]